MIYFAIVIGCMLLATWFRSYMKLHRRYNINTCQMKPSVLIHLYIKMECISCNLFAVPFGNTILKGDGEISAMEHF